MGIELQNVCKSYTGKAVLRNISLEVKKGEIVGFLGPNGAGKTTTIKILTNFTAPDSGRVLINKVDAQHSCLETRAKIGYLPENNPLYTTFYVDEALHFIAKLRCARVNKEYINYIVERTGLGSVRKKKINILSKGYRQRLGLAQALLHDPEILILDEPTNGLDHIQVLGMREMIKEIAVGKAVIMSTHMLAEAQLICSRVVIINEGSIVKEEASEQKKKNYRTAISFSRAIEAEELDNFLCTAKHEIRSIRKVEPDSLVITSAEDIRKSLFAFCVSNRCFITRLADLSDSLEERFKDLRKLATQDHRLS